MRPRRGQARAPRAVPGHVCGHQCTAVAPALLRAVGGREEACRRFCQVRLTFGDNPFGGIACWGGAQAWVELHVPDVYRRGYLATVLPELRTTRGGGVSLRAVKLVALAMAQAGEHSTGRGSRLTVATIMARTGLGESTVQRARHRGTGIARREHCDLQSAKATRRTPPKDGPRSAPPIYVPYLGRGIPKNSVKEIRIHRALWHRVLCDDPQCCPDGEAVLADARQHAIVSRARDLAALSQIQRPSWRWARLAGRSREGLDLAGRINALADRTPGMAKIDLGALTAIRTVAELRRQQRRFRKAA